jgi:hypothetical protein
MEMVRPGKGVKEAMMFRSAGWTIGIVLLLADCAAGQNPAQPEQLPLPKQPPIKMPAPASEGTPQMPAEVIRQTPTVYADVDYLAWWVHHGPAPVLLTTAPNNGLNPNGLTGGILGQPGTMVVFDGHNLGYGVFSALRMNVGVNVGPDGFWSLDATGFVLPRKSINFTAGGKSDGTPLLTIPFLDAATAMPSSLDINSQDALGNPYLIGNIFIHSDMFVWGVEFNAIAHSIRTAERNVDVLLGFRTLGLTENLSINQTIVPTQDGNVTFQFPTAGQGINFYYFGVANQPIFVVDSFSTKNQFYGPQVGGRFHWDWNRFTAELTGKVAVGVTHQEATIVGASAAVAAINPNTGAVANNLVTPGGMFALVNNIGSYTQNPFTVVPEIGITLKYAPTSWLNLHVGYGALYWSNVARPGALIDTVLNSKLIPTGALLPTNVNPADATGSSIGAFQNGKEQGRPYFTFRDQPFWAQGISVGIEFRY